MAELLFDVHQASVSDAVIPLECRVLPTLVALGFLIAGSTFAAQNRPLPDQESFLRDVIAFLLTPRRDAKPKTHAGEQIRHFSVRAWVSENDHELVKLEAEAIDSLTFGLVGLARLHKGARLSFLRRKVNGEVWLPAVASYTGSARLGLLFTLRRSGTSEYSGYRKYSVDTFEGFRTPK